MPKAGFYAVQIGRKPGIYNSWDECKAQIDGHPYAKYKKFSTLKEAETFVGAKQTPPDAAPAPLQPSTSVTSTNPSANGTGESKSLLKAYYAVQAGRTPGVYESWNECEAQVKSFPGAVYRKFKTLHEAMEFAGISSSTSADSGAAAMNSKTPSTSAPTDPNNKAGKSNSATTDNPKWEGWNIVYTDGACKGNGKVGSIAGIGVWWGWNDPRNIAERCPGDQTNNRAELIAIVRVLETTPISKIPLLIRTDSRYSIQCVESWIHTWQSRAWHTSSGAPVKNKSLIQYLSLLLSKRAYSSQKVRLEHVRGHQGIEGNEAADRLANLGSGMELVPERDWDAFATRLEKEFASAAESGSGLGAKGEKAGENAKNKVLTEQIEFDFDQIEEGDLLSPEELEEMSRTQVFD